MFYRMIVIGFLLFSLIACSELSYDPQQLESSDIKNLKQVDEHVYISGQPTKEQFELLAESGIKYIINLRPNSELTWDEKEWVESKGMRYIHIPVGDAAAVNIDNASRLIHTLNELNGEASLVHCGSGNRIGALVAIDAAINNKNDLESAIAKGKDWGLTRLEPFVRNFIQSQ